MTVKNFEDKLNKYADLITQVGVNVQPGQTIILTIGVDQQPLAHAITQTAYDLGADEVVVEWTDDFLSREFLTHTSQERLTTMPAYIKGKADELMAKHASRITVLSDDPDALAGLDSKRLSAYQKALSIARRSIRQATMNNDVSWLVVGAAGQAWAEKVFPDDAPIVALDKLWDAIFFTARIDTPNPIVAWRDHIRKLSQKADWLNSFNFKALKYSAPTADITIGLADQHVWEAAGSTDLAGNFFVPNIPTEEVFTAPDNRQIDGWIKSTKPLTYNGHVIDGIELTFAHGKITNGHAATNDAIFQELLKIDDGTHSLGEVSLVPDPSPISQSGIIFLNTLFDENAANHIAIGAAYPFNIKNGTNMTVLEQTTHGLNQSVAHVDFMVGSAAMDVDGIQFDGTVVPIFRHGDWA